MAQVSPDLPPPNVSTFRRWQIKAWALLDDPSSSKTAKALSIFIMIVIGISVMSFTLESTPTGCRWEYKWNNFTSGDCDDDCQDACEAADDPDAIGCSRNDSPLRLCKEHEDKPSPFYEIEFFCIMVFSVEYIARLLACPAGPGVLRFLIGPMNIIDLLAILPWYIDRIQELASPGESGAGLEGLAVLRILRLTRVMRIFKMSRNFQGLILLMQTFKKSAAALLMLVFFVGMSLIVFATLIYYAEQGIYDIHREQYVRQDGTPTPFESIPTSMWWCIVTMTTVGYGDDYPTSMGGKMVAILTMFCGLIVLSLPITIIGANFDELYREQRKKDSEAKARKKEESAEKKRSPSPLAAFRAVTMAARLKGGKGGTSTAGPPGEAKPARERKEEPLRLIQDLVKAAHDELARDVEQLMMRQEEKLRTEIKGILLQYASGNMGQVTPLDKGGRSTKDAPPSTPSNTTAPNEPIGEQPPAICPPVDA